MQCREDLTIPPKALRIEQYSTLFRNRNADMMCELEPDSGGQGLMVLELAMPPDTHFQQ